MLHQSEFRFFLLSCSGWRARDGTNWVTFQLGNQLRGSAVINWGITMFGWFDHPRATCMAMSSLALKPCEILSNPRYQSSKDIEHSAGPLMIAGYPTKRWLIYQWLHLQKLHEPNCVPASSPCMAPRGGRQAMQWRVVIHDGENGYIYCWWMMFNKPWLIYIAEQLIRLINDG